MKRAAVLLILVTFVLIIIFLVIPFLVGAVIEEGSPSYFLSIISGLFLLTGGWQLFRGKIGQGIGLLLLSGKKRCILMALK